MTKLLCFHALCASVICAIPAEDATGRTGKLSESMKQILDDLCPGVDMCNTLSPIPRPSEPVVEDHLWSCCQGCSCHEDCDPLLTCCYRDNVTYVEGEMSLDVNVTQPAISAPNNDVDATSTRQCIYIQTGTPDADWPAIVPAYAIISRPPPTGCRQEEASQSNMDVPRGSCSLDADQPWGDLLPVYSTERHEIYLNENCARCHGVHSYVPWTPILVCDAFVTIQEHFAFLEGKPMSGHCFITFKYDDRSAVASLRCYVDTVQTCSEFGTDYDLVAEEATINMTTQEVEAACHSGFYAPVHKSAVVYRNIFCAVCSSVPLNALGIPLCYIQGNEDRSFGAWQVTYLLDMSSVVGMNRVGSVTLRNQYPIACLRNGTSWVAGSCRHVYCPTGQTRSSEGSCHFPSKQLNGGRFLLVLKLEQRGKGPSLLELIQSGAVDSNNAMEGFRLSQPWLPFWSIDNILHVAESREPNHSRLISVRLQSTTRYFAALINDIRTTLAVPWRIAVNGTELRFDQSILEYTIIFPSSGYDRVAGVSAWNHYSKDTILGDYAKETETTPTSWGEFLPGKVLSSRNTYTITTLYTCEQISLTDDEYSIMAYKYLLINNLSGRLMFDREFELIKEENGNVRPRVCLSDTPLVLRNDTSCAPILCYIALPTSLVFVLTTLHFGF